MLRAAAKRVDRGNAATAERAGVSALLPSQSACTELQPEKAPTLVERVFRVRVRVGQSGEKTCPANGKRQRPGSGRVKANGIAFATERAARYRPTWAAARSRRQRVLERAARGSP